eukprot:m.893878 g.893878  ORF g.893878 m.893878 type:complete len:284 (-) comp23663_c3_seq3:266-1117(-)
MATILDNILSFPYNVHMAVSYPEIPLKKEQFFLQAIAIIGLTVTFRLCHMSVLTPIRKDAQYFALHTWVNIVIVWVAFPYAIELLKNPSRGIFCDNGCANQLPNVLTTALHLYHIWMYTMKPIDLIHHIPAFFGSFLNMLYPTGPIQNFTFLFMMGIPGGYDYALLVGMKHGLCSKMLEKRANSRLNLWLRSPGLIVSSFCIFQSLTQHQEDLQGRGQLIAGAIMLLHNLWNAQYFMSLALQSEAVHAVLDDRQSPDRWLLEATTSDAKPDAPPTLAQRLKED